MTRKARLNFAVALVMAGLCTAMMTLAANPSRVQELLSLFALVFFVGGTIAFWRGVQFTENRL